MGTLPGAQALGASLGRALTRERLRLEIRGVVQGVGFRPFVHRLATRLGLDGWIRNNGDGVTIEVEGPHASLLEFFKALPAEKPPAAILYASQHRFLPPADRSGFEIRPSERHGLARAWVLPDLALCDACARELDDPRDRRHRYPFVNCTHCGPRFTILEGLPYDRLRTVMSRFPLCAACAAEYRRPADRRFHAEPVACPRCGPRVSARTREGLAVAEGEDAIRLTVGWIREGRIVGVKGLGGYHIVADARAEGAIAILRERKRRPRKPFAVLYPDVARARRHVRLTPLAETLLTSAQAPIVLLERRPEGWEEIAASVAPDAPDLGVFLPYTPLHRLLCGDLGLPLVATSGNVTDEPIAYRDEDALERLAALCDAFLTHDRPIARHVDDSVLRVLRRPRPRPQVLRRARGYSPLPVIAPRALPSLLAVGGHFDSTFALTRGEEILLSQHVGDLETYEAREAFRRAVEDWMQLFAVTPRAVARDLHPEYVTTEYARGLGLPVVAVQHHHAHLAACLLENQHPGPALGITWDGTGYGTDGSIWGGEFLLGDARAFHRVATLRAFRLAGGEAAVREPWRVALALLHEAYGEAMPRDLPLFTAQSRAAIEGVHGLLRSGVRAPVSTSMGRLFDGVSAILGLSFANTHQSESAQALEYAARRHRAGAPALPYSIEEGDPLRLDWRETIRALVAGSRSGTPVEALAASFHAMLVDAAIAVAHRIGCPNVALSGGVFANVRLSEEMLVRLEDGGFVPLAHSLLPPTDGSLPVGQAWVAAHVLEEGEGARARRS